MSDNSPTITIITPCRNAASTIKDCILSVNHQTYACEHIIIDGASTDGTQELIAKLASPRTKLISEPDRGLYDALNKGLKLATGDVVGILHADDFYAHDSVLEHVAGTFREKNVDSCYGDLLYVDPANVQEAVRFWKSGPYRRDRFYRGWMPPHPTFFVRRSIYETYGDFNLGLGTSADYELMLRFLFKNGISAAYLPEVLVIMRAGGLSNRSWKNRLNAHRMDRRAWKINELSPMPWTLLAKPLSKILQFSPRSAAESHPIVPWWPVS
jgi:glycosyltransferase involved in cell wall biosynthesis